MRGLDDGRSEEELLAELDRKRVPAHIAVIMDGNGRWARKRGLPRSAGHRAGVEALRKVVRAAAELGVRVLTVFVFSSENWSRPNREVSTLMLLLARFLRSEIPELNRNRVRLRAIGRLEELPARVRQRLQESIKATSSNNGLILNLALNYGGRGEILDAVKAVVQAVESKRISVEDIDEKSFGGYLYAPDLPDPDLLIRTSGEQRISNFLLWETSYSELMISPVLWPNFGRRELLKAIVDYQNRERRFGGL